MLRITQCEEGGEVRLKLAGQVAGAWVEELERFCTGLVASGAELSLALDDVTYADGAGADLLRRLHEQRVNLNGCSAFLREQIRLQQARTVD